MTLEQVVEKREFLIGDSLQYTLVHYLVEITYLALVVYLLFELFAFLDSGKFSEERRGNEKKTIRQIIHLKKKRILKSLSTIWFFLFAVIVFAVAPAMDYNRWIEEDFIPYLIDLPEQQTTVENIEFASVHEAGEDEEEKEPLRTFYGEDISKENLAKAKILYVNKEGYGEEYHGEVLIQFDLKEGENPYMVYKELEEDMKGFLGNESEFKKGVYSPVVHLKKGTLTHLEKEQ